MKRDHVTMVFDILHQVTLRFQKKNYEKIEL